MITGSITRGSAAFANISCAVTGAPGLGSTPWASKSARGGTLAKILACCATTSRARRSSAAISVFSLNRSRYDSCSAGPERVERGDDIAERLLMLTKFSSRSSVPPSCSAQAHFKLRFFLLGKPSRHHHHIFGMFADIVHLQQLQLTQLEGCAMPALLCTPYHILPCDLSMCGLIWNPTADSQVPRQRQILKPR